MNVPSVGDSLANLGKYFMAQEEKLAKLEKLVMYDTLTGCLNGRGFNEMWAREFSRMERHDENLAVAYLDLDHFKAVNDTFGHDVGDSVLQKFVTTIQRGIRPEDVLARLHGEEFALLLPMTTAEEAGDMINRLRETLAASKADIPITFSAGVTKVYKEDTEFKALKRADNALYEAKGTGRNRVVLHLH